MNSNEYTQKVKLAYAFHNAMFNPTSDNVSKLSTEWTKTDIECSQLPDRVKEILKIWIDLGHELFVTHNYDQARVLYSKVDFLLRR